MPACEPILEFQLSSGQDLASRLTVIDFIVLALHAAGYAGSIRMNIWLIVAFWMLARLRSL
jgi:hypothetical protein